MAADELLAAWAAAYAAPVNGWDFSALGDRYVDGAPPWSYAGLARQALAGAHSVVDMGTGGGEFLLTLADALPPDTVATEGWPPNLPVATAALAPSGIEVVAYDAEQAPTMPFPDGRFDTVLNRHEAYVAAEVARVLAPGGRFVTQQVDGRSLHQISERLTGEHRDPPYAHITLDNLRTEAAAAGFRAEAAQDWQGEARFGDVTTLVRYLALVPWEAPDNFTVERYADALLALHRVGQRNDGLTFAQRRFFLACRKSG